jgi:ElaB/YqjD/DUF883 family membrane-anchored ribosome-binding protein
MTMSNFNQTVTEATDEATTAVKDAGAAVKNSFSTARHAAEDKLGEIESHVLKNPNKALGVALVAGAALGFLLSCIRRHD